MNEELKQRIADSLDKVVSWVEQAEAFTREQAPLVVGELLTWGFWSNLILFVGCCVVLLACIATIVYCLRKLPEADYDDSSVYMGMAIGSAIVSLIMVIAGFCYAESLLKVCLAPRVYILEQLGRLL